MEITNDALDQMIQESMHGSGDFGICSLCGEQSPCEVDNDEGYCDNCEANTVRGLMFLI